MERKSALLKEILSKIAYLSEEDFKEALLLLKKLHSQTSKKNK